MLNEQEMQQITEAIRDAERMTSGEIRVCIARKCKGNPLEHAVRKFRQLEMHKTRLRNAVLIFVAPDDRKAAIYGDSGIHETANVRFWDDTLSEMTRSFSNGQMVEGILQAVANVGELIKLRYPILEDDINELSNEVIYDNEE